MLKLEMKLDIERIEQAQKYTPQVIQSSVDNAFGKYGFRRTNPMALSATMVPAPRITAFWSPDCHPEGQ